MSASTFWFGHVLPRRREFRGWRLTNSPERYPVAADTRIDSAAPTSNYGSDTNIRLIKNSVGDRDGSVVRGLLRFDLPDVPQAAVADARLWMTLTRVRGPEGYDPYSRDVVIRPLTAGFAELGATWLDRDYEEELLWTSPGGDFSVDAAVQIPWSPPEDITLGDGSWQCSWDLRPLWDNADLRDNGVVLMLDPETPPETGFLNYLFSTRESSAGPDNDAVYVEVSLRFSRPETPIRTLTSIRWTWCACRLRPSI